MFFFAKVVGAISSEGFLVCVSYVFFLVETSLLMMALFFCFLLVFRVFVVSFLLSNNASDFLERFVSDTGPVSAYCGSSGILSTVRYSHNPLPLRSSTCVLNCRGIT